MTTLKDLTQTVRVDRTFMLPQVAPVNERGYIKEVDSMKETIGEYFPSKFLRAEDIKSDLTLTISGLEEEAVGKDDTKPVMRFTEIEKGFVMNKTNAATITELLGTDRLAEWIGKKITLFKTTVPFGSEMKDAIRVRPTAAAGQTPAVNGSYDVEEWIS